MYHVVLILPEPEELSHKGSGVNSMWDSFRGEQNSIWSLHQTLFLLAQSIPFTAVKFHFIDEYMNHLSVS